VTVTEIKKAALALSEEQRRELALDLLDSTVPELSAEQASLLEERATADDADPEAALSSESFREKLDERLSRGE
jgi:hypothetical protein